MDANVLLKEYPWISALPHPLIAKALFTFRVLRLDVHTVILRSVGRRTGSDSYGYFLSRDGEVIGTIHPKNENSLVGKIAEFFGFKKESQAEKLRTIEAAASQLTCRDILRVSYVVIVEQFRTMPQKLEVEVLKIPKEIDFYQLLAVASNMYSVRNFM